MNKPFLALLSVITLLVIFASPAKAATWECQLAGEMSGVKLGFIFGGQVIRGDGEIRCATEKDGVSRNVKLPVRLSIVGGGVGFDFTIVRHMQIFTNGIGGVNDPRDLTGQFNVAASAGVTLIDQGRSVDSAISVKHKARGLGFEVGMTGEDAIGLGARVHGLIFVVEPRN